MYGRYQVGPFTDVAPDWVDGLWRFLNEPGVVTQMENASNDRRPAVEGISVELVLRFGHDVGQDRVKQFIGYLVRQVMERNGYAHESYGHTVRENPVFTKGSRYVRQNN